MAEQFINHGVWWLPDDQNNKYFGYQENLPNGQFKVSLISEGQKFPPEIKYDPNNGTILNGCSLENGPINIVDVHSFRARERLHFDNQYPRVSQTDFFGRWCLLGPPILNYGDIAYNLATLQIDNLFEWAYHSKSNSYALHQFFDVDAISIRDKPTYLHSFNISIGTIVVYIIFDFISSDRGTQWTPKVKVSFLFNKHNNLEAIDEISRKLAMFISLATMAKSPLNDVVLVDTEKHEDYVHTLVTGGSTTTSKFERGNMLFGLKDTMLLPNDFFDRWLTDPEFYLIYSVAITAIFSNNIFPEDKFIAMTRILERYERNYLNSHISGKGKFDRRLAAILDQHDYWVKFFMKDRDKFIKYIVQTRNTIAHHLSPRPYLDDINKFFRASDLLELLVCCCILGIIGFHDDFIKDTSLGCFKYFHVGRSY
ncbi:MAG: HEPN domain-containing protein [Pseudomonadota bacterium]